MTGPVTGKQKSILCIWNGFVPITTKTDVFAQAWHAASSFVGPLIPVRSILRGKRMTPEESFAGYINPEDANSPLNRVHLIGVLHGGGNKTDLALTTNKALMEFMLQNGSSSISTAQFVKDLLTCAGVARIQQILSMRDTDAKLDQLKSTALHFHIALPEFADLDVDSIKRVKRIAARKGQEPTLHQAADSKLPDTLFHDASGAPVPAGNDRSKSHGVYLIDAAEAQTFYASHCQASHPRVMVTLGPTCPLHLKLCQPCNFPATDAQGNKVVIATCVHFLSAAKVFLQGADQADITTEETSVLAFTAWRSEVSDQLWEQLCEGPLRTIWKQFSIEPAKTVVTKPWGRSWRADSAPADPFDAQSFQVHVRVYTSTASAILAQSGAHGIFVNPKVSDGNATDPSYAVI